MLGGMLATSWIQILWTTTIGCVVVLFVLVLVRYGGDSLGVFQDALDTFAAARAIVCVTAVGVASVGIIVLSPSVHGPSAPLGLSRSVPIPP
jgi:Na+(H+)/acetate symporter ActP